MHVETSDDSFWVYPAQIMGLFGKLGHLEVRFLIQVAA